MSTALKPVLTARNLVAGYTPGTSILNDVSVEVVQGQIRCVLGPNGTGKSTLLKVLFGFLPAQQGEIRFGEVRLNGVPPHAMGEHGIAYLPQKPSIFPYLSVAVNLRLGTWRFRHDKALVQARVERAYEQFSILHEKRDENAGTLSGGQQRQLEIARSLLTEPTVFLIDEPTASIEPRITTQIYELIAGLARQGKAILLVDQNIKGALGIADHVYVMRTGALFAEGDRSTFDDNVETLVSRWLYTRKD